MSDLKLVSFNICPFVQRSVAVLNEKNVPFEREYIDLTNKPDWFMALSPLGKVPLLIVNQKQAVFESSVICEYLDETTEGSLHPSEPLARAQHRAWIEFCSATLMSNYQALVAPDEESYQKHRTNLNGQIQRLMQHWQGPYFAGSNFHIIDACWAPVFRYAQVLNPVLEQHYIEITDEINAWQEVLFSRDSIKNAVSDSFEHDLLAFIKQQNGHISRSL